MKIEEWGKFGNHDLGALARDCGFLKSIFGIPRPFAFGCQRVVLQPKQMHNVSKLSTTARICGSHALPFRGAFLGSLCKALPALRDGRLRRSKSLQYSTARESALRAPSRVSAFKTLEIAEDTIYALSTAPGRAGIAIVRISGPACLDVSASKHLLPDTFY